MFSTNRIMTIILEDCILVHLNGKEICLVSDTWDTTSCLDILVNKLNEVTKKSLRYIEIEAKDIDISEQAMPLLYDVKQFTQEEELAFMNADWDRLDQLLLQRIEDGDIE